MCGRRSSVYICWRRRAYETDGTADPADFEPDWPLFEGKASGRCWRRASRPSRRSSRPAPGLATTTTTRSTRTRSSVLIPRWRTSSSPTAFPATACNRPRRSARLWRNASSMAAYRTVDASAFGYERIAANPGVPGVERHLTEPFSSSSGRVSMRDWKLPWAGGCRCGRVRIAVSAPPMLAAACHCKELPDHVGKRLFTVARHSRRGFCGHAGRAGGRRPARADAAFFCPFCKSWMFTRPEGLDWLVNVRPSMLDDHPGSCLSSKLRPARVSHWARTPAKYSFAGEPELERYQALVAEFGGGGCRPSMASSALAAVGWRIDCLTIKPQSETGFTHGSGATCGSTSAFCCRISAFWPRARY